MRQIYLQSGFYHLAKMPVIHASEGAKQRERTLIIWETLCQQGMNREEASKVVGGVASKPLSLETWATTGRLEGA